MDINGEILLTIKKGLSVPDEYDYFNDELITHINSVFSTLTQLGVGPEEGFTIETGEEKWSDYCDLGKNLEMIKSYMILKVRLMFDPPSNSFLVSAIEKQITEYEWRICVMVDYINSKKET